MEIAFDVLEPFERVARRRLQLEDFRPPCILVLLEGRGETGFGMHVAGKSDGTFKCQLGARADREMRARSRVAHEGEILVRPALAQHAREVDPSRAANVIGIRDQAVAVEMIGENALAGGDRLFLRHRAEAELVPGLLAALDDKRRGVGVELICVRPHPAVSGLLEDEGERVVEFLPGAKPHELASADIDIGLEHFFEDTARLRIQPIRRQHHVMAFHEGSRIVDLGLEFQLDSEFARALLQEQ